MNCDRLLMSNPVWRVAPRNVHLFPNAGAQPTVKYRVKGRKLIGTLFTVLSLVTKTTRLVYGSRSNSTLCTIGTFHSVRGSEICHECRMQEDERRKLFASSTSSFEVFILSSRHNIPFLLSILCFISSFPSHIRQRRCCDWREK
jgi:hypothetical protein